MAAKGISHADLVTAFERRWDHYSARVMAGEALASAGVKAGDSYADKDVSAVVATLTALGGADAVIAALSAPAPAAKAADKAADKPAAKAKEPAKKAPAKKAPAKKAASK